MTAIYTGLNFFGIKLRSFKVMNLAICFGIVLFSNVAFTQSSKPLDSITTVITAVENSQDFNNLSHDYIDLLTIAAEESRHSKIDRLHFYAAKALKLSEQIGYIKGEINSLLVMGYYHAYNGNFEKSSENQLRAYEMAVASKNQDLEIKASYWIGRDLKDRSQYGEALEYLYHAIDLSTIADDKFHLSRSKGIIAHMYRMNHNYEESLIIYKEILAINEQHGDDFLSNVSRANLSILYGKMGETEKALEYIDAAMNYAKEINHKHFIAFTYGAKGGIYEDAKNPKLALEWYEISKNSLNGIDDNRNMAAFLTGMALAHFQLDNSNEAEALALESLKLAEPLNLPSIVEKNYELLYRIYSAQNKADKALGYHVAFKKIADSTSRQMNSNGLEILKAKMEFDKQKESDKLVSDLELSKQKRFTYLGILSVLILAFIIYLLISRSRVRQKLLHELKQSNQTKDKLFSVIGHDLKNPIMSLQQLLTLWINKDLSDTQLVKYIPKLSTRVDAISFMLNNLLSWGSAQIEGGEKEFHQHPTNIANKK